MDLMIIRCRSTNNYQPTNQLATWRVDDYSRLPQLYCYPTKIEGQCNNAALLKIIHHDLMTLVVQFQHFLTYKFLVAHRIVELKRTRETALRAGLFKNTRDRLSLKIRRNWWLEFCELEMGNYRGGNGLLAWCYKHDSTQLSPSLLQRRQ